MIFVHICCKIYKKNDLSPSLNRFKCYCILLVSSVTFFSGNFGLIEGRVELFSEVGSWEGCSCKNVTHSKHFFNAHHIFDPIWDLV